MHKHAKSMRGVKFAGDSPTASGKSSSKEDKSYVPKSPPKPRRSQGAGTAQEINREDNLHLGGAERQAFIEKISQHIVALSRQRIRKPAEVANALNGQKIFTALGDKWTPNTAWWLLYFVFSRPKQIKRTSQVVKRTEKTKSESPKMTVQKLTPEEMKIRLYALQKHFFRD